MFAELLLSTNTRQVLNSAIDKLMTNALSCEWWSRWVSSSVKLMAGLSTLVALGGRPKIWTLYTIRKYVFLTFLEEPASLLSLTIPLISSSKAFGLSSTRRLGLGSLGWFSLPLTNCCSFPCLMRVSIYCFGSQHLEVSCLCSR